jgi:methylthioribose-1-phosphate isomerase
MAFHEGQQIEPRVASPGTEAVNFGFDVTPARLIAGIITERGVCDASEESIVAHYPEFADRVTG